jgi:hypothetical protein
VSETPRLLLMSATERHPDGLANSSGMVGRNLMFNAHSVAYGKFEHPLNEHKSIQCTRIALDYYDSDEKRGFYGGGAFDARPYLNGYPRCLRSRACRPTGRAGAPAYKEMLSEYFTRNMAVTTAATSLPMLRNNVTLDPEAQRRLRPPGTARDLRRPPGRSRHVALSAAQGCGDSGGGRRPAHLAFSEIGEEVVGAHLLGTCRMGDDPASSVVDRWHRSHDINNLFICDGSSLVTSGRGQPTLTIQALAFRAADYMSNNTIAAAL